jgi:hypothetical protein
MTASCLNSPTWNSTYLEPRRLNRWLLPRTLLPRAAVLMMLASVGMGCSGGQAEDEPEDENMSAIPADAATSTGGMSQEEPGGVQGVGPGGSSGLELEVCLPTDELDEPDDEHIDSNCDGFDGDVQLGIFVSPDGDDAGGGTMDDPVATIGEALIRSTASSTLSNEGSSVFICDGVYIESIEIPHNNLRLYGGYNCGDGWTQRDGDSLVGSSELPLRIRLVDNIVIDRVSFLHAAVLHAAVLPALSTGASIDRSSNVLLKDLTIEAVSAAVGKPGEVAPGHPFGGDGGRGGDGAPGAGGPSFGLALVEGQLPTMTDVTVQFGEGGLGGSTREDFVGPQGIAAAAYDFELGEVIAL